MAMGSDAGKHRKAAMPLGGHSRFDLLNFYFLFHIYLFALRVVEDILQKRKFLVGNDFNAKSVFHLPFPFQGHQPLVDVGSDVRVDV